MSAPETEQLLDPDYVEDVVVAAPPNDDVDAGGFSRRLGRWVAKGGLAIVDQGLISGSNFLIGILLARWLIPAQYGAFSLAFSVFLLLSYVYHALLSEPQGVFSGSAYSQCLRGYLKALLGIQAVLTVFGLVLLGGAAAIVYAMGKAEGLPGALAGVAIASPCILFFWLLRRAYYMNLAPARAAIGAFIYCVLVTGGLLVAYKKALVSPFTAYLLMAIGALGTGFFLLSQVNKVLPPDTVNGADGGAGVAKTLGIWALGAGGFGGHLDSLLHVLPAGERVLRDGAGGAIAGADESVAADGAELHGAFDSFSALRSAGMPRKGHRQFGAAGAAHHACCSWWERSLTGLC